MASKRDPRPVTFSYRLYRVILRMYPRSFQREYRAEVAHLFRDCCRESYRSQGVRGIIPVWGRAILDLARNVPQEYVVELTTKQPEIPRTLTRCSYCSEEIIVQDARCIYCGALLSIPLATTAIARPDDQKSGFFEDTPSGFISGVPPGM